MAVHRYYRLYVTTNWGGPTVQLNGLELRASVGGTNLSVTGSGTASSSAGATSANAFDNNDSTIANFDVLPAWLKWDFGAGNEKDILQVALKQPSAGGANITYYPKDGFVQYSDNNTNWTLHTVVANNPSPYGTYTYLPYVWPLAAAALVAPAGTLSAYSGAYAEITAPSPYLTAFGGGGAQLVAPAPTLYAAAHSAYGENAAILVAPKSTLEAYCGGWAKLSGPVPTLATAGTVTAMARASLTAPTPTLSATGTVAYTAYAALKAPRPNLVGYGGAVCSITTPAGTLTATGTMGGVAQAALSAPLPLLSASATAQNHGGALLVAPAGRMVSGMQAYLIAPAATLTAIGTAVITATYEAYALNLKHISVPGQTTTDEMTRYTNFPFTQVVRYQNSYYGVNDTGLYLLEGTTDDGDVIPFTVQTAVTDFGVPNKKTINSAYFGGRLGPAETVSVLAGETTPVAYSYTTPRGPLAQNYRQAFGRGIKARYFALRVVGTADFKLDTLDTETDQLTRRI